MCLTASHANRVLDRRAATRHSSRLLTVIATALWLGLSGVEGAAAQDAARPERVLITNDNGIEDPRLVALAHAFEAAGAEVWVAAPAENRSGFSNFAPATQTGVYRVRPVDLGGTIRAWAVDGAPTDSVIFAVTGPMRDHPPTLVVSGINGGANAGDGWVGSGTVGAARTAAGIGFPAVAVSGVPSHPASHHRIAADWVVAFTRSPIMRELQAPDYLTISFPEKPLDQVQGAVVVPRATALIDARATLAPADDGWEEWTLAVETIAEPAPGTDLAVMAEGVIAVVTMRVGDENLSRMESVRARGDMLPGWTSVPPAPVCPLGVGVEDRLEQGALVTLVTDGGAAQRQGIQLGDMIVQVDAIDIATATSATGALADAMALRGCADSLTLTLLRDGASLSLEIVRAER